MKTIKLFKILASKTLNTNNNKIVGIGDRADKIFKTLFKFKKLKNKKFKNLIYIRAIKKFIILIPSTGKVFICLKQAFIKVLVI